jgi:hypothetical protein
MRSLLFSALLAGMCATATPKPEPNPAPAPAPTIVVVVDAGTGPQSPLDACDAARQHMVELSCPPDEDAFGGWVAECSGWSHPTVITDCIKHQTTCHGTRQCLGDEP